MPNTAAVIDKQPELRPANENPWYVLATLHGQNHRKNRRDWNKYFCTKLDKSQIDSLRELKDEAGAKIYTIDELTPHSDNELVILHDQLANRINFNFYELNKNFYIIDFSNICFGDGFRFEGFIFPSHVNFENTKTERIIFSYSIFYDFVNFDKVHFCGNAIFIGAIFKKDMHMRHAIFLKQAVFSNTIFNGAADFTGIDCKNYVLFNGAFFHSFTSFNFAKFCYSPPKFHGASMYEGTIWRGAAWPNTPNDVANAHGHAVNYEKLKQEAEKLKKHEQELEFFALEMRAKRVIGRGWHNAPAKLVNWLYDKLSDYGRSIIRPIVGLLITAYIGFLCLWDTVACDKEKVICQPFSFEQQLSAGKSLGLSLTSLVGFLPFKKDIFGETANSYEAAAHGVMTIQSLLGLLFLFLLGLALKNRFRLR